MSTKKAFKLSLLTTASALVLLVALLGGLYFSGRIVLLPYSPYAAFRPVKAEFTPQKHKHGELVMLEGHLPLLRLFGTNRHMGLAHGALLSEQTKRMVNDYLDRYFTSAEAAEKAARAAKRFEAVIPDELEAEMHELARAAGVSYERVLLGNALIDVNSPFFCSAFLAQTHKTKETRPILGRNLDFPSLGVADDYSMLMHVRKHNRIPFVAVGWPGMVGVMSGMNAHGLVATVNISLTTGHRSKNPDGYPVGLLVRRILEKAKTLDEATQILGNHAPASSINLMLLDKRGRAANVELSPVVSRYRYAENGFLMATNTFITETFTNHEEDERYRILKAHADALGHDEMVDSAMIKAYLDSVNLDKLTLQSMIFEPTIKTMHLSISPTPATKGDYLTIDCKDTFGW